MNFYFRKYCIDSSVHFLHFRLFFLNIRLFQNALFAVGVFSFILSFEVIRSTIFVDGGFLSISSNIIRYYDCFFIAFSFCFGLVSGIGAHTINTYRPCQTSRLQFSSFLINTQITHYGRRYFVLMSSAFYYIFIPFSACFFNYFVCFSFLLIVLRSFLFVCVCYSTLYIIFALFSLLFLYSLMSIWICFTAIDFSAKKNFKWKIKTIYFVSRLFYLKKNYIKFFNHNNSDKFSFICFTTLNRLNIASRFAKK